MTISTPRADITAHATSAVETANLDAYSYYGCDAHEGIPDPWTGNLFADYETQAMLFNSTATINRIGLVLACSSTPIWHRLVNDAHIELIIGDRVQWEGSFTAFFDQERTIEAPTRNHPTGDSIAFSSTSLPVAQAIVIPTRQTYYVRIELPKRLEMEIELKERDVYAFLANQRGLREPEWFIRIGVGLIGTRTRAVV